MIGLDDEDRLVGARLGQLAQPRGDLLRRALDRRHLDRPLGRRPVEHDVDAGAALDRLRRPPRLARRRADARVERREALGGVAVVRVPGVPCVGVRQRDAAARAGRSSRSSAACAAPAAGAGRRPAACQWRPASVTRSPASRPRTIANASSNRETRRSYGIPNAANSSSFQPAPSPSTKRPPLTSSIVAAILAISPGGWNAGARDERPEPHALGRRGERRRAASTPPTARARAGRRRGRAGGRRARSSRTRPPRPRAPSRGTPASGPRARPPGAGSRPAPGLQ